MPLPEFLFPQILAKRPRPCATSQSKTNLVLPRLTREIVPLPNLVLIPTEPVADDFRIISLLKQVLVQREHLQCIAVVERQMKRKCSNLFHGRNFFKKFVTDKGMHFRIMRLENFIARILKRFE